MNLFVIEYEAAVSFMRSVTKIFGFLTRNKFVPFWLTIRISEYEVCLIEGIWLCTPLLIKRYNLCRVLAFSTIYFYSRRSCASSDHLVIFIFLKSFLTSSSLSFLVFPLVELQVAAIYIFSLQNWFRAFCVYGQTNSFVWI